MSSIDWDSTEYKIREFVENLLDGDHVGWSNSSLVFGQDVPVYETEVSISEVLDNIPFQEIGLKNSVGIYLQCQDGDCFIFFDDKPRNSVVSSEDYKKGIKSKINDMSKVLGKKYTIAVRIINENNASRIAWTKGL